MLKLLNYFKLNYYLCRQSFSFVSFTLPNIVEIYFTDIVLCFAIFVFLYSLKSLSTKNVICEQSKPVKGKN